MKRKVLITTGGSGGHVVPALTFYEHLKDDFDIFLSSDYRGSKFIDNKIYNFEIINVLPLTKNIISKGEVIQTAKEEVIFKVQIGSYLQSMKHDKSFIKIEAQEEVLNQTFKYYVGNENQKSNADIIKTKMRNLGFYGAFVVAFYQDTMISMQEALDLQAKTNNDE